MGDGQPRRRRRRQEHAERDAPVEQAYPHLTRWVMAYGWIEVGQDPMGRSFAKALDEGGMIWEGEIAYPTLDAALRALDAGIARWMREERGE
jgi:hypothetical protein